MVNKKPKKSTLDIRCLVLFIACRWVSKRLAGTKSDESTFISSLRIVAVDGVNVVVDAAAAGFNVDKRSTILLLLATPGGISPDIEEDK